MPSVIAIFLVAVETASRRANNGFRRPRPLPARLVLNRLALIALCALAGCRPADDTVRSYDAPKEKSRTRNAPPAAPKSVTPAEGSPVRTLAVIVPGADKFSRYIKLKAATDAVDAVEPQYLAFVKSIQVPATDEQPLTYDVPAGWLELPKRQFVAAAFRAGSPEKPVEITVSGPIGGDLLGNVNRWRKEVGLDEVGTDKLPESSKPLDGGPPGAILVDIRGTAQTGNSMRGPFQK